jgi:DNA-binding XRE family transcriptional regulator
MATGVIADAFISSGLAAVGGPGHPLDRGRLYVPAVPMKSSARQPLVHENVGLRRAGVGRAQRSCGMRRPDRRPTWALAAYGEAEDDGGCQHQQHDREAYIKRVGGVEEAERRRKALMAGQSGHRLAEERKRQGLTQAQLAQAMGVSPGRVSQIERGELATIDAVARYVEALGGRLDLVASFGDHTLVTTTEAA